MHFTLIDLLGFAILVNESPGDCRSRVPCEPTGTKCRCGSCVYRVGSTNFEHKSRGYKGERKGVGLAGPEGYGYAN